MCGEHSRLRLVGLSSAGDGVANAGPGHGVHRLHDDEGPLLQRGHRQVPVVRHRLQVGAVARPHGVPHLQDPRLIGSHLQELQLGVRTGRTGLVLMAALARFIRRQTAAAASADERVPLPAAVLCSSTTPPTFQAEAAVGATGGRRRCRKNQQIPQVSADAAEVPPRIDRARCLPSILLASPWRCSSENTCQSSISDSGTGGCFLALRSGVGNYLA